MKIIFRLKMNPYQILIQQLQLSNLKNKYWLTVKYNHYNQIKQKNTGTQMIQQRKQIRTYNEMLMAYQSSCNKIKQRYTKQTTTVTDSVKVLDSLFQSYLIKKTKQMNQELQCQVQSTEQSSNKNNAVYNYSKVFEEDSFQCPPTSAKKNKHVKNNFDVYNKQKQTKQNLILSNQIDKLNLNAGFLIIQDQNLIQNEYEEEDSPTKKYQPKKDQFKNKNIADIIMESQKKVTDKMERLKQTQKQNLNFHKQNNYFEQESSQYQITDYSSNESSNEGSYSPYYAQQVQNNKPLFGGLFSKTISSDSNSSFSSQSNSNLLNFNFSSKELLKSPKKLSKNKRSRLYVRAKKIPKWAQDLSEVQKICANQEIDATSIFGKCIVQNLNTNLIFHKQSQDIVRTSSAKWNSQIFLT